MNNQLEFSEIKEALNENEEELLSIKSQYESQNKLQQREQLKKEQEFKAQSDEIIE